MSELVGVDLDGTKVAAARMNGPHWEGRWSVRGGLVVRGRIANAIEVVIGGGALGPALLAMPTSEKS